MEAFAMPPLLCFLAAGAGWLLWRRRPRLARALVAGAIAALVALCTPLVSALLLCGLQQHDALAPERFDARCAAIVVLAGDVHTAGPEYGGATCGPLTVERLRYAAHLARATGLPLLVSGGVPRQGLAPHAQMMQEALERDFGLAVRWTESHSANTRGNVRESVAILRRAGVERAYVVTHAWHMPRTIEEFERVGFSAVAAPTGFRAAPTWELGTFVPSAKALQESAWAWHEWLGRAWYALSG